MSDAAADPFGVLGLQPDASAVAVRSARRDLAKQYHPDTGGDADRMRTINAAAGAALHLIARRSDDSAIPTAGAGSTSAAPANRRADEPSEVARDVPSFTVEALPVETFEALLVVTSWIGKVLDDEPPYLLDTHLYQPGECWCRLELVPDAGASTVSITIAASGDEPPPPIEVVRDTWVEQLNRYDWD